jgi:hypothetical protein
VSDRAKKIWITHKHRQPIRAASFGKFQIFLRAELHFVLPRREIFWNCSKKAVYFVQPRREKFGIANKSIVFCSAVQRKIFELCTKSTAFFRQLELVPWQIPKSFTARQKKTNLI